MVPKLNCILDLDNTLISSISYKEMESEKVKQRLENTNLVYYDMPGYYHIYLRPHLQKFLDYVFKNFNVTVWTAGSQDYASFIINKIIKGRRKNRKLKLFLYDKNCEESQKLYSHSSPKDLKYVYNFPGFKECNTFIVDDLKAVSKVNPHQTIRADYFDAKALGAEKDDFLLWVIEKMKKMKEDYDEHPCH
jgi:hypothetical protein